MSSMHAWLCLFCVRQFDLLELLCCLERNGGGGLARELDALPEEALAEFLVGMRMCMHEHRQALPASSMSCSDLRVHQLHLHASQGACLRAGTAYQTKGVAM